MQRLCRKMDIFIVQHFTIYCSQNFFTENSFTRNSHLAINCNGALPQTPLTFLSCHKKVSKKRQDFTRFARKMGIHWLKSFCRICNQTVYYLRILNQLFNGTIIFQPYFTINLINRGVAPNPTYFFILP